MSRSVSNSWKLSFSFSLRHNILWPHSELATNPQFVWTEVCGLHCSWILRSSPNAQLSIGLSEIPACSLYKIPRICPFMCLHVATQQPEAGLWTTLDVLYSDATTKWLKVLTCHSHVNFSLLGKACHRVTQWVSAQTNCNKQTTAPCIVWLQPKIQSNFCMSLCDTGRLNSGM